MYIFCFNISEDCFTVQYFHWSMYLSTDDRTQTNYDASINIIIIILQPCCGFILKTMH
jgi:hypothetical protein